MEKYDLAIIGAGPSGYAAAMRALDFKKKILLIERKRLGGTGVTNGALSSKTWWEISTETSLVLRNLKRFNMDPPQINYKEIQGEVIKATDRRKDLLRSHMELLNGSVYKDLLNFELGNARLASPNEIEIETQNGKKTIWSDYVILATGSRPRELPHIPLDEKIVMTSEGIEKLEDFPDSMVIVGAGVIGCEYATIFSGFGKTKVNLIDKGDRILPNEDDDVVKVIETNMEANGVLIHRNSRLTKMDIVDGKVNYELEYDDGRKEIFHVERALLSVGRIPNYENLGLEEIGVNMALVNVGELEGRYAVECIFGNPRRKLVYENISTIMFLNPEVAGVGLNEIQAKKKGIDYKVASLSYECIPRAIAQRNTQGFIKLLVTNDEEMKILGMRVIGQHSSSAIQAVALLISMDKGIEELAECVHPHPSIIEGIQEVVRMLMGKSLFKPDALKDKMRCSTYCNGVYEDILF
jgi:dihydrolipoamide dehydrogenase